MFFIDATSCMTTLPVLGRRTQSEPSIPTNRMPFIRFRSLREGCRMEGRDRRIPVRVDIVSIASSTDIRTRNRRRRRERAKRRIEALLSSSSSLSETPIVSDVLDPILMHHSTSPSEVSFNLNGAHAFEEFKEVNNSESSSKYAILMRGENMSQRTNCTVNKLLDIGIEEPEMIRINNTEVVDRLHLNSEDAMDEMPLGWHHSISYASEIEQFIHSYPLNPFADPFEDEERRSRTEMWVESTSPGLPESDEDINFQMESTAPSLAIIPQVTIDECSENSLSPSLPSNSARHTTRKEEQISKPVQMHVKLFKNDKVQDDKEKISERIDSLHSSDVSEGNSMLSSEMDKNSIVRLKYKSNLDQATENTEQVNFEDIERFWRYRYTLPPKEKDMLEEKEHEDKELDKIRSHTPTIERVVLYYTTDKRPLTPSVSSAGASMGSPTPEPSSRSPSYLSAYPVGHLFKQPMKEEKMSSSPSDSLSTSQRDQEKAAELENSHENEVEIVFPNHEMNKKNDKNQSSELEAVKTEINELVNRIPYFGPSAYFRLDKMSESDSEEGRVGLDGTSFFPLTIDESTLDNHIFSHSNKDHLSTSSSTDVLPSCKADQPTGVIRNGLSDSSGRSVFEYKNGVNRQPITMTTTPPLILEETIEDIPIPDWDERIGSDIESSSMEDLLAIDTRPSSSGRKSVTFSEFIDIEMVSPDFLKKVKPNSSFRLMKPILKKEDKQRETMKPLLEYVAERLYKDLRMLVEERERTVHGINITPDQPQQLGVQSSIYQLKYRDKLVENKAILDKKIDQVWKKLKEMDLEGVKAQFVYSVSDSSQLTISAKKRGILPRRHTAFFQVEKKKKNEIELASEYARRLAHVREQMMRRDSEIKKDEEDSVEDILRRVSRALGRDPLLCQ